MVRYNHRFRLLYRLLDESGLEWLSDEVRSFAVAPPYDEMSETQVETMRDLIRQEIQIPPQIDTPLVIRSDLVTEPRSFEECIQYLIKRIENLAAYLEAAVNLAKELGIDNVQLGPEANGQADLIETVRQLRSIHDAIQTMVVS